MVQMETSDLSGTFNSRIDIFTIFIITLHWSKSNQLKKMKKQKLIFVVDDDPVVTKLIEKRFTSEIYQLETFFYGEDCLKALFKNPDLIILDYYFHKADQKVMNGMEVFDKNKRK